METQKLPRKAKTLHTQNGRTCRPSCSTRLSYQVYQASETAMERDGSTIPAVPISAQGYEVWTFIHTLQGVKGHNLSIPSSIGTYMIHFGCSISNAPLSTVQLFDALTWKIQGPQEWEQGSKGVNSTTCWNFVTNTERITNRRAAKTLWGLLHFLWVASI